ncbi:MAG TPA: hypothetical protein VMA73_25455 [Streptosporangiaceae bacterium]|nr:hypothetical protein [Streptosporangiaceae bacterium]
MSSTLTPTCPLCGLGYPNQPLLELHVREDHPRHQQPAGAPQQGAGSRQGRTKTTQTAAFQPGRPRSPAVLKAAQRTIRTIGTSCRQLIGRMTTRFSPVRRRHPLEARTTSADHDAHASPQGHADRAGAAR